jgi:hypothetical protein
VTRAALRSNPLRADANPEPLHEGEIVPAAAWRAEADIETPIDTGRNPLR